MMTSKVVGFADLAASRLCAKQKAAFVKTMRVSKRVSVLRSCIENSVLMRFGGEIQYQVSRKDAKHRKGWLFRLNELQRSGIHAVAKPGRFGAVIEDVTEVGIASL